MVYKRQVSLIKANFFQFSGGDVMEPSLSKNMIITFHLFAHHLLRIFVKDLLDG